MKHAILYRKNLREAAESFLYAPDTPLTLPLHRHDDYELICFTAGQGRQFVGDTMVRYGPGDMVLIGAGVPHLHLCDARFGNTTEATRCELLQFPRELFPERMERFGEYVPLARLLGRSACGVKFRPSAALDEARELLRRIGAAGGIERLTGLLVLLDHLARRCSHATLLAASGSESEVLSGDPVARVCACIDEHFAEPLTLRSLADVVGMAPASLCRCFRRRTGTTLFDYLNRIRVERACHLLCSSGLTVAQVALEAGFVNLSHFNRQFRRVTGCSPRAYRRMLGSSSDAPAGCTFSFGRGFPD